MQERLYKFIPQQDRHLLSLNFLLAQKVTCDTATLDLKSNQKKIDCRRLHNHEYFSCIFTKHISRYLSTVTNFKVNLI